MKKAIDLSSALGLPPLPSHSPDAIGALLWAREALQQHLTTTYAAKGPKGIEELKPVKIGGIDQWLHIRGRNRNNPVLLYLHGGPGGGPWIGVMDAIQRPWEDYFTVVHWDQRGTGKSYYPANDKTDPTVERLIEDAEEVTRYLRRYLNQDKLFVLGHSWGTALGMHLVKNHPDWYHAYIGVSQVVNMMDNERVLYERLLSHAKEQKKDQLVIKLEAIAPYPNPDNPVKSLEESSAMLRRELCRLAGEAITHHIPFEDIVKMANFDLATSPHRTLIDISRSLLEGDVIFRPPYRLAKEFMAIDLPNDLGCSFEVPIFFFTGAHDWHTPRLLSDKWFSQINAPYKELIHFEESSHVIVHEEPGKVLTALVNKVLPFAQNVPNREATDREVNHA